MTTITDKKLRVKLVKDKKKMKKTTELSKQSTYETKSTWNTIL